MPEHETSHQPRHDTADVNTKGVVITGVALAAIVLMSAVICYGLFGWFVTSAHEQQPPLYSWAASEPEKPPEFPRLEGALRQQTLEKRQPGLPLYQEELKRLNSYGWVNREGGVAHIPIERAMQIIVEQEQKKK